MKKHFQCFFTDLSQVLFLKSPLFGILFSVAAIVFSPTLFLCGLLAALIGYVSSRTTPTPKILKDGGLFTVNGFFFGVAMASMFQFSVQFYICLMIGALIVPLATKVAYEVLQHWKLSPFIISYILVVWVFTLSATSVSLTVTDSSLFAHSFNFLADFGSINVFTQLITETCTNMGRLFFLPNASFGLVLLILLSVFSPRQGVYFFLGTTIATVATHFLSGNVATGGDFAHYSYSAGLVGLALASFPEKYRIQTILFFCLFSTFLTFAFVQLLTHSGLPTLSLPYVFTVWISLLSRSPRLNVSWSSQ